ncbi:hypothetical protein HZA96_06030 [Candidatus Woesearchaeota archaeon]|nr:hypothetical protein [Candidatus Woesearchaeota archaeon]
MRLEDLFNFVRSAEYSVQGFSFYVVPRAGLLNLQKAEPAYAGLFSLPIRSSPESILRAIKAERAHLRVRETAAGFPVLLPYSNANNKLMQFDFISIRHGADIPDILYGYTNIGSKEFRDIKYLEDNLFERDICPQANDVDLLNGFILKPSRGWLGMSGDDIENLRYSETAQRSINSSSADATITFRILTELNYRSQITAFKLEYWVHRKSASVTAVPRFALLEDCELQNSSLSLPHAEFYVVPSSPGYYHFGGYVSEAGYHNFYSRNNISIIDFAGRLPSKDKTINMEKTFDYLFDIISGRMGFNPARFADLSYIVRR